MTDSVRGQYEDLPYPARNAADEARRLITGSPSHMDELNHYLFAGRRDFSRPFRALVAGGGTGDGLIMLAQHLTDQNADADIVYLDLSAASRRIAEDRAAARGLTRIRFYSGSLLDLATLAPGPYDYIDCCGVLHHLDDPAAGLAALTVELAPDGGMGLMLYGELGRTGVYDMQEMLRLLAPENETRPKRMALARQLIGQLPPTNRFRRNPFLNDHVHGGDAGLYDLLLHSRDRAYRVGEIDALLATAGLEATAFLEPARYDPANYLASPALRRAFDGLAAPERRAVAELLAGNIRTHVFYAVRQGRAAAAVARPDAPEAVPVLRDRTAGNVKPNGVISADLDGVSVRFPLSRMAPAILARIDGQRSLGEIAADLKLDQAAMTAQFAPLYAALNGLNKLYLRYPASRRK